MEYFRGIKIITNEKYLQESLVLNNLDKISSELFNLEKPSQELSIIGGIWGEFTLSRSEIKGGVRFALLECPNALCWTITTGLGTNTESIIIHLTINRQQITKDFTEEIEAFLEDHCACLETFLLNFKSS
jgi:hypothetical protein